MTWRPGIIAAARAVNGALFVSVAAFCFLCYSPFAYGQFIKPKVVPDLNDFVVLSPWLFLLTVLITALTFMPQLKARDARGRAAVWSYIIAAAGAAAAALVRNPLVTIANTSAGLIVGLAALAFPVALALIDHLVWPQPSIRGADRGRVVIACLVAAGAAWATYAIAVPVRLTQVVGVELPARAAAVALGTALAEDLIAFAIVLGGLTLVSTIAGWTRSRGAVEYWLAIGLLGLSATLVFYFLVCASLAFAGPFAWLISAALGVAIASIWSDVARLRVQSTRDSRAEVESLALFAAPVAGVRSRVAAAVVILVLPAVAYLLVAAVVHFDWDFLLQKLGVLVVWLAAFVAAFALVRDGQPRRRVFAATLAFTAAAATHVAVGRAERARPSLDRYVVLDPSFRLIRDVQTRRSAETAAYYALLREHTLVPQLALRPVDIDFVPRLGPAPVRPPHVFLFIVDSMRRDYLSPYNPAVEFTPGIARFARDSFVFERGFSRYAGTALSVPSIWAGGMVVHTLEQKQFEPSNTLLKLLDANRYVRIMSFDHVVEQLVPIDESTIEVDRGKGTMAVDMCTTLPELTMRLRERDPSRPVFFYSLPQNVHIATATRRREPTLAYPGFFAPIAASLSRIDRCFGNFIDDLQQLGIYDDSVIVLISDHGDSLGEEGRWGHSFFMVPEVMRVPLIVHLPPRLRDRVSVDLQAVSFSADITPSLYALLGYDPVDLGPLFGRPLFVPRGQPPHPLASGYLLASSYGAVYGMLTMNGRRMTVVDAVDGHEAAYDLSTGLLGRRVDEDPAMIEENRRAIAAQLSALASVYGYLPEH